MTTDPRWPASTPTVTVSGSPGRIAADCRCGKSVQAANKGFGRAAIAVFITQHQHLDTSR